METYTIATLKEANRQRPILCPDTPNLYFCAVIEMDFDGPDFMGPPILDCVKTYYEGKPALALVYDYNRGGADKTGRDAISAAARLGLSDNAALVLMDQNTGKVSRVEKSHSAFDMLLFITSETKYR